MAEGKKSFIAYSDWKNTFDELPNEEAGMLIKHIFAYVNDENPQTDSVLIKAVFANIKSTLKRDLDRWESQLIQRSNAGKRSAQIRSTKLNDRSTTVNDVQRNSTDNVSVNVNDINNIKEIIEYLNQKTQKKLSPKTKETVRHLTARLKTYTVEDAKKVIDIKVDEWMGTEWEKYLVPDTLFSESNFEKYLNQKPSIKKEVCPYTPEQIKKFRANLQGFGSAGKDFDMKWIKELQ